MVEAKTEYFLVNEQDYFVAGYVVSNDKAYIETTGGLATALAYDATNPKEAKEKLYAMALARPVERSERTELTAEDRQRLVDKLDHDFKVVGTDQLMSC